VCGLEKNRDRNILRLITGSLITPGRDSQFIHGVKGKEIREKKDSSKGLKSEKKMDDP